MLTGNQPDFGRNFLTHRGFCPGLSLPGRIVIFLVVIFGLNGSALAQFVVQPMKLNLNVRGGQFLKKTILLQNYGSENNRPVELDVVELGQNEKGDFITLTGSSKTGQADANEPSSVSSCRSWLKLNKTSVTLKGKGSQEVEVSVRVPAGVRGFYCAAIRASIAPTPGVGAVTIKYEMIVPVLVEVEGTPLRNHVTLNDAKVEAIKGADGKGSTELSFYVSNTGNTMATVMGKGWVKYWDDHKKRWRPVVSEFDMLNNILIPGTKAVFRKDIGKQLPTGRYRIMGMLNVEGHEGDVFDKKIQFVGKAGSTLVQDAAVRSDRDFVEVDGQVGRTRRATLALRNYSLYPITIQASTATPDEMKGKIWYGRKGDDMSCANWIEVRPKEIRLQPFASRNVRVVAKIPSGGYRSEGYYADLTFRAQYSEDGSKAGSTTVLACVKDTKVKHALKIKGKGLKLNSLDGPGQRYLVATTFENLSDFHVMPEVRARLVSMPSQQAMKQWGLTNTAQTGVMLPYENRSFSTAISLSDLTEGNYQLTSEFVNDGKAIASIQKNLKIYREGGQKRVEIITNAPDQTEAGSETPTVSW